MQGNGDYISRDAVVSSLNRLCDRVCQYSKAQRNVMCGACPLGDAFMVIEDGIPAADVRPKWISVEERLPELHDAEYLDEVAGELIRYKESAPILIWLAKGGFMDIGIYEKSDSVDDFCYQGVPHTVTYWMPLPSAPEEKADA